jgi:hypothetical protein
VDSKKIYVLYLPHGIDDITWYLESQSRPHYPSEPWARLHSAGMYSILRVKGHTPSNKEALHNKRKK